MRQIQLTEKVAISLDAAQLTDGIRAWVTGESGSGKSNTCMLIASQWADSGRQLIVLDSHGEYRELWQLRPGNTMRIGYGDEPVNEASAEWVMEMVREGKNILIDLSHWTDIDHKPLDKFVRSFMVALYAYRRANPAHTLILLEEAQQYAPQAQSKGQNDNVKFWVGMLTGGRKYGLHFIVSSQKQGLVDIGVVSQCNFRIFMRVSDVSDWKKIKPHLPGKFPLNFGSNTKKDIKQFKSGEAVVLSRDGIIRGMLKRATVKVTKFLPAEGDE